MPGWRELFAPGRGRIAVGLVLMEFLAAVQVLVGVAALPALRRVLPFGAFVAVLVLAGLTAARRLP